MGNRKELEASYNEITALYDLADKLILTVKKSPEDKQQAHYEQVCPVVDQLEASADILTEEFIGIAERGGKAPPTSNRNRIEAAFRMMLGALDNYAKSTVQGKKQALEAVSDIVDPVIKKIKQQVEKVITIFVGFVELSLDRIMQKADLERLRKREAIIDDLLSRTGQLSGKTT